MSTRLGDLVERLGGELRGDPDVTIYGIAPLDIAQQSHITFLANPRFKSQAAQSKAAALILSPADDETVGAEFAGARIVTRNPYAYYARAAQFFVSKHAVPPVPGTHPSAVVDASAKVAASAVIGPLVTIEADAEIGEGCIIDAGCFIGRGAKIGAGTRFCARVVFHAGCVIGKGGIIHSGAVIGSEGFGFANEGGKWIKIPQTGRVVIGDDVQIGANTTVDRGAMTDTVIEDGVKLDNQIQIAHNCHIGAHTAMAGCVGVAGSTRIGKHCTFGGAAMISGHLSITDNVHISAATMISRSIHEPGQYTGFYPFAKNAEWEKSGAVVRNLPSLRQRIRELERTIDTLEKNKDQKDQ